MKRRGIPSPDLADAVCLCFGEQHGSGVIRGKDFNRNLEQEYKGLYV